MVTIKQIIGCGLYLNKDSPCVDMFGENQTYLLNHSLQENAHQLTDFSDL